MQRCILLLAIVALLAPVALPQSSTGTVSGTVRDQSGAVIPNQTVTLTNTATNVSVPTRTNEVGFYYFPTVIPGPYRLTVEAPGMAKHEVTFTVQVSQSVVIDPVLRPAQAVTTVEVTAVTPMVTVDRPTVQSTVDRARIEQLPMNGRELRTLLRMLPGSEGGDGRRMYGMMDTAQEWLIDGAPVQDYRWNMVLDSYNPGVGAIQEFSVDSSAVSAKQSRPANVMIATKSGTNQLHGSAYETHRNSGLGVARSRTDYWEKPPHLVRNEFGVNVGGPMYIPGVYDGRNRSFWFFNYEGYRLRQPTTRGYTVPTAAMRNGDFSGLKDSQGRLQTLYDPNTTDPVTYARQPFSYGGKLNAIDPSRISPVAKYLFSITPMPTLPDVNPLLDVNYWVQTPYDWDKAAYITRIDHRFSDKDSIFGRFTQVGVDNLTTYTGYGTAWNLPYLNDITGWKLSKDRERHASITWTHTFSPTFFNELVVSGRRHFGRGTTGKKGLDKNYFTELKLPNPFGIYGWPQFYSTGLGSWVPTAPGWDQEGEIYYNVDNNATRIVGRHELAFGAHFRRNQLNLLPNDGGQSAFNFNTLATALYDPNSTPTSPQATPLTGHNIGNLYLGSSTYSATLSRSWTYIRSAETALYIQDNYKLTPRLTLNLGLRWESWPAYREKRHLLLGFDAPAHATVLGTDIQTMYALRATLPSIVNTYQGLGWKYKGYQEAGLPQNMVRDNNANLGPRLGFAYRALSGSKSFVVRGGYSLSYFVVDVNSWINDMNGNTPFSGNFNFNLNDAAQSPDRLPNYWLRSRQFYINGVNDSQVLTLDQPRGVTRGSATATSFSKELPVSRVHTWNLTLEKEVMSSTVARARYVGTHSGNLLQFYSFNDQTPAYVWYVTKGEPLPTGEYANVARRPYDQQVFGTVRQFRSTGWGNTSALSMELERRYSQGYAYQLSYTITNSMYAGSRSTVPELNLYLPGAVPADYDKRNRFLNYSRDTGVPKHSLKWNWLVDLPFGKGKPIGRNISNWLDKVVGGWQLAGIGTLRSNYFSLPTNNWNFTGEPIKLYGYKYPIQNCTSGVCIPGYLWWNGYIPANKINSVDANGKPNGYMGVPADYRPAVTPLIPWGSTTLPPNAPANTNIASFWDTNNVWIPLKDGTVQRVTYDTGLHPWRNQRKPSIRQWGLDASLFKNIPINERFKLRLNGDFFNVFNHPNNPNSVGGDGFLNCRSSGSDPRVLQLSLRLEW